jgi:cyclic pyranopterin phosphate synthase
MTGDEGPPENDDADLTHVDESGDVQMVDVGEKPNSNRRAVARGTIHLTPSTVAAIREDGIDKGDVLATARVGAVQAVKHTWETIPMCHQIPITNVDTDFDVREASVVLTVAVETTGKTGCEMEALEGVTTGLNVVWDMVKAAEKDEAGQYPDTRITDVHVVEKEKRRIDGE